MDINIEMIEKRMFWRVARGSRSIKADHRTSSSSFYSPKQAQITIQKQ